VLLKEKLGKRYLPIWIGPAEADAIIIKLQGTAMPRPLSHDLLLSVIGSLGAGIESIIINEIKNDTFYGRIILNTPEGKIDVDSRPSDALALAIRAEVPIFVEDVVLDNAGIIIKRKKDKDVSANEPHEGIRDSGKVDEQELKRLSAYRDLIEGLDIDDLGSQ
jgi:bifunctional DNase/RNase